MAESISSVGTGKDYADLIAWNAGEKGAIAAGDQAVAETYGIVAHSAEIIIDGWTFGDSTSRIIIRPADGEKHTGKAGTGSKITNTVSGYCLKSWAGAHNITIQDLEIEFTGHTGWVVADAGTPGNYKLDSCIVHSDGAGTGLTLLTANASTEVFSDNNIFYDLDKGVLGHSSNTSRTTVRYNTAYNIAIGAFQFCNAYNILAAVLANCFSTLVANDSLVSGDSTADDDGATNFLINKTDFGNYLVDPLNDVFSLKGTTNDNGVFGATGVQGTHIAAVTVDILGNQRDPINPDVGAFEFVPPLPTPRKPLSFFEVFTHLLPNARAWRLTIEKQLREYFEGLTGLPADVKVFADDVYEDLFPQTTRELDLWENQFGLPGTVLTEQERRDRLDATWAALGGQDPRYIQDTLQGAGFDVYVHEWWDTSTPPVPGTKINPTPRDPTAILVDPATGYPLVNKIFEAVPSLAVDGAPLMQDGDPLAMDGLGGGYRPKVYTVPTDQTKWPYFLYIGGATFPNHATVSADRRNEFETLCLKICPTEQWLGILVDYV